MAVARGAWSRSRDSHALTSGAVIAALMATAAALRLARREHKPVLLDELGQIEVASRSLGGLLEGARSHLSPPLDYMLTSIPITFGIDSVGALRLLPLTWGVLAVLAVYLLGRRLSLTRGEALTAAWLLAISPYAIEQSAWVRMYSLFSLLSIATLAAGYAWSRTPDARTRVAFVGAATLLLYTHTFGVFVVAAPLLLALGERWPLVRGEPRSAVSLRECFVVGAIVAALYLPWFAFATLDQLAREEAQLYYGHADAARLLTATTSELYLFQNRLGGVIALGMLVLGTLVPLIGVRALGSRARSAAALVVLATVLPLAVLAAHTELLGPVTTTRNLIFLLPVYVLMLALGGAALGRRAIALVPRAEGYVRGTGLAFAVLLTVGLVYAERVEPADRLADMRTVAATLEASELAGDELLLIGFPTASFEVLYDGEAALSRAPSELAELETLLRTHARRDEDGRLWVFLSRQSNNYWRIGVPADAAAAEQRADREQRLARLLDEHATLALRTAGGVPTRGLYLVE